MYTARKCWSMTDKQHVSHLSFKNFLQTKLVRVHLFLSVYSPECLAAGPFVANAMLDIQQSYLGNCRTRQSVRKAAPSHSSASLPYAEIKKSQGTCKPGHGHGRVTSPATPPPPPKHHLSWLVAAAVQIMTKQAFQLAPDSWHERSPCPT